MLYKIHIQDATTGLPVPTVTAFLDATSGGNDVVHVGSDGLLVFDDTDHPEYLFSGNRWVITAPGYADFTIPADKLETETYALLGKPGFPWKTVAIVGGIGLGAHYLLRRRRGRMGAVGEGFDYKKLILPGAIVVAGLVVYNMFFSKDDSAKNLGTEAGKELNRLIAAGHGPSMSVTSAETFASAIVTAVDDCGTDESLIKGIMDSLQNKADVMLLLSVYGVRDYKGCFDGDFFSMHSRNLAQTLTSELSSGDIDDINGYFSAKGIDYKF